jgi:lipase
MSQPTESRVHVNGVDLTVFEWAGEGPPIVFAHATGFHARCWDQVIRHLPGRHCIAVDMRGHGRSDKPPGEYQWADFGHDVAALGRALELEGAIGVGHSMGGHSVTLAASLEPALFRALLLVDPVILPPAAYTAPRPQAEHFAARRRNEWESPEAMFERFRSRPPYAAWQEQVLRDYCEYGLLPNPGGEGYVLACPPKIEATIYGMSAGGDIYNEIAALDIPVRILRAKQRDESSGMDMSASPTNPNLASHFRHAVDLPHPELTHFIPMEAPELVAREVLQVQPSPER